LIDWVSFSTSCLPQTKRTIFDNDIWTPKRFFRAWRLWEPIFRHALACFDSVDINLTGAEIDSFDSANPAYSTDGRYDPLKRKDGGNVVVNSTLFYSLDIGNAVIRGKVSPADALRMGTNASVGSLAWVDAGNVGIEPGWISNDSELHAYLAIPPFTNGPSPPAGTVEGTNYAYVLESGNYLLPGFDPAPDGRMRVVGNAVLYIQGDISLVTEGAIEIDPGASLKLYAGGVSISIRGNGVINRTGNATNFQLYAPQRLSSLRIDSYSFLPDQSLTGIIYAPNSLFDAQCLASFHFMGAIVSRTARISGPFKLHFDENLRNTLQR
jgi:hypothetical protein